MLGKQRSIVGFRRYVKRMRRIYPNWGKKADIRYD